MTLSITRGSETITASEEFGSAYLAIRETLADSSCWRAIVEDPTGKWSDIQTLADLGTSSRTDALAAIVLERRENEGESIVTPSAIIRMIPPNVANADGPDSWTITGAFEVKFDLQVPDDYVAHNDLGTVDFVEKISRIWREMRQVDKSNGGRLFTETASMSIVPGQYNPDDNAGIFARTAEFQFSYMSSDL